MWTFKKCYTFDLISKKGYCSHIPMCASPGRRPVTTMRSSTSQPSLPYWVSSFATSTTSTTEVTRPSRRPTSSWKCGAPVVKDQDILASVTNLGIFFLNVYPLQYQIIVDGTQAHCEGQNESTEGLTLKLEHFHGSSRSKVPHERFTIFNTELSESFLYTW